MPVWLAPVAFQRFHIGGMMWPRRIAIISRITPVVVHSTSATAECSIPKLPPVSSSGPSMVAFSRPGSVAEPETMPEKTADWK